jgi:hypothetical protein
MPSAAPKTKKPDRRDLCEQLLALRVKHADTFAEIESLKATLIEVAGDDGSFREVFIDRGQVSVSAPHPKAFKGHSPDLDVKAWDNLSDVRRKKLVDEGLVLIRPVYSREFRGRCDIRTF